MYIYIYSLAYITLDLPDPIYPGVITVTGCVPFFYMFIYISHRNHHKIFKLTDMFNVICSHKKRSIDVIDQIVSSNSKIQDQDKYEIAQLFNVTNITWIGFWVSKFTQKNCILLHFLQINHLNVKKKIGSL